MLIKIIICFSLEVKNHQENEGRLLFLHPGGEFFQIEFFCEIYDAEYSAHGCKNRET